MYCCSETYLTVAKTLAREIDTTAIIMIPVTPRVLHYGRLHYRKAGFVQVLTFNLPSITR